MFECPEITPRLYCGEMLRYSATTSFVANTKARKSFCYSSLHERRNGVAFDIYNVCE